MDLRLNASHLAEGVVVVHELSPGFFIQTWLREGYDQQTSYDLKDVFQWPSCWIPVSFQSVDADFARERCDVGMEYFGEEEALGSTGGEAVVDDQFAPENSSMEGCADYMKKEVFS